jgi:hypothetical protein
MKIIGVLLTILGLFVLVGGVGYSIFLINEQSRQTYLCSSVDAYHKKAEKAAEALKAAKGTSQERDLEKDLSQQLENEKTFVQRCSDEKAFYKTWTIAGFSIAAGGFLVSLLGLGVFLFGRKRSAT